jgi:uncharacterized protein (TIGR03437 family)
MIDPRKLAAASSTRRVIRRVIPVVAFSTIIVLLGLSQPKLIKNSASASITPALHWYRGSTHTHTNNSFDGESSPAAVAARYKQLGYNFVLVTDHNKHTSIDDVNAQVGEPGRFLVMRGEEVTDSFNGTPVHVAAVNNSNLIAAPHGTDIRNTLQNDIDAIRQAGGLAIIAHPNYRFAISSEDLKHVEGASLFEVYNAHPVVNNFGDATHPAVEANWDEVLSSGKVLYGVAVDDEHTLVNPVGALPGRAWIMVRAASLDVDAITQAMASGEFYATTGIILQDYLVSSTRVTITLPDNPNSSTVVDFIGRNGQLLQRSTTSPATYLFTGHEQYVRAKIYDELGQMAWTQPIFTERLNPVNPVLNGASLGTEPEMLKKIAPDSVAIITGIGLAETAVQSQPESFGVYPTVTAGTSITVNGRAAEIFYVSPTQVNFHVPALTELGVADVVLTTADGLQLHAQVNVADSAPGIFTINGSGAGRVVNFDLNVLLGNMLVPNDNWRRFYLYSTGVRGGAEVQVWVDGQPAIVDAVRKCRGLPGLDQITIVFPRKLGVETVSVVVKVDGATSNTALLQL